MDLTTAARVKALISSEASTKAGANVDAELARVVTLVSGMAEAFLNRQVAVGNPVTEYFDVEPGARRFSLRAYPVTSVTSVHFDLAQAWGSSTLIAASNYASPVYDEGGFLEFHSAFEPFRRYPRSLRVIYVGGMAANADAFIAAYPDIADAIDLQCSATFHLRNVLGMQSDALPGGGSMAPRPDFWIPPVKAVLERYRRVFA